MGTISGEADAAYDRIEVWRVPHMRRDIPEWLPESETAPLPARAPG